MWQALELLGQATPGQHNRVAAGGVTMAAAPTTVVQHFKKFKALTDDYHEILGNSKLLIHFFILVYSSLFDADFWTNGGYAYQNWYADWMLNNGTPEGIYSYIDLFTWEGWMYGFLFWLAWHVWVYLSSSLVSALAFMIFYLFVQQWMPLCADGDFDDLFFKTYFGWDFCAWDFMKS